MDQVHPSPGCPPPPPHPATASEPFPLTDEVGRVVVLLYRQSQAAEVVHHVTHVAEIRRLKT